ncbi:MAG: ATP-dependent deoxyribonuclease subunit A [Deltaproteobacteria bacterium]|nr:MAG: ATP-dependent deoxyribonuclease subunit A [Deltaproteobacteria bacterium]
MTRLADQEARDRIRDELGTTLVVEAASGTGKTTELVTRMVALLTAGRARLDHMVAVTFTDAAAGELKLRLRKAIEDARRDPACPADARELLDAALPQLEEARIGTIHSFCADLLRERPVEARVDPLFEVASKDVAEGLLDRAFDRWFEEKLAHPGEAVRRILRRRTRDEGPRRLLRTAARDLVERRDFPAAWRHEEGFDRDGTLDALMEEMATLGAFAATGNPDDHFVRSLTEIARFVADVRRREAVRGRDHDGLEAELLGVSREKHWRWTGFRRVPAGFPKAELLERRTRLRAALDDFVRRAGADLAPRLRDELWPVVEGHETLKNRAGCLDFLDLLLRARDLLRENAAVRTELQRRFTHLFVDEFQDTDPLQVEILLLLAADDPNVPDWRLVRPVAGKLFLVGDPKQSIYRFRRADVALYERVKRQLVAAGAALLDLSVSFRAVPEIQEAVNAAFAPRMQGEPRYVPLAPYRPGVETQPSVVALPVPAPYGDYGTIVDWRIDESLPDAIAAFVQWLVEQSGWTVTERERPSRRVPVRPRHVCLLFRRFRAYLADVTRPYVRALEARHLPHLLVGGTYFHVREEVEAIRNALAAIERPEDELAVFATLHGPFFALGDGALLAFRKRFGPLHPFCRVPDDEPAALREVRDALAVLRALHRGRNRRPIADTIGRLLAATRAHAGLAVWPTGEQALANVTRLMDLARRAERTGLTSFRAFVEWLAEQAEHGEASDAPIVEEGTEGVRMMTVHGAKGLEFPVVILADLTCKETSGEPRRWADPDRGLCVLRIAGCTPPELQEHAAEEMAREGEEATRVLYVAATRARDLLVVPALGDGRYDGWLQALSPVLYPPPERVHVPETRQPPGCPAFGAETTTGRPENVARPPHAVMPGLHVPTFGRHRIVWWDPATLALDVQESVGLAQQKILAADERGVRAEEGVRAHAAWQAERERVRADGSAPSLHVVTATEHAAVGAAPVAEVAVESVDTPGPRPHGKRFGTLVHAVLAAVELDADRAGVADVAALQGRLLGARAEEVEAAADTAARALAHPLLRRAADAARAGRCRRECPVGVKLAGDVVVEGVVDAAFLEDGAGWTVVDFKTDVEIAGRLEEYRRQVGLYAEAVRRATGGPARGVLLRV